jgi:hypothetical protein
MIRMRNYSIVYELGLLHGISEENYTEDIHSVNLNNSAVIWRSCEIVALRKLFVDGQESYDLNWAQSFAFIAHENVRAVLHLFPHFLIQSGQKNGIKKFSRHFPANRISLLTSDIF